MNYTKAQYKRAFEIACDLLNGTILYGIDADKLFNICMDKYGVVTSHVYEKFILANIDRFSDDGEVRQRAIDRLDW